MERGQRKYLIIGLIVIYPFLLMLVHLVRKLGESSVAMNVLLSVFRGVVIGVIIYFILYNIITAINFIKGLFESKKNKSVVFTQADKEGVLLSLRQTINLLRSCMEDTVNEETPKEEASHRSEALTFYSNLYDKISNYNVKSNWKVRFFLHEVILYLNLKNIFTISPSHPFPPVILPSHPIPSPTPHIIIHKLLKLSEYS